MKEVIKILKNYKFIKKEFFFYLFFGVLTQGFYMVFPQFTQKIISIIENKLSIEYLYFCLICLAFMTIFVLTLNLFQDYFGNKFWHYFYYRKSLFYKQKIFEKNAKDILDIGTGKLIARFDTGIYAETEIFKGIVDIIITSIFRGLIVFGILFLYLPELVLVLFIGVFLVFVSNFYLRKYIEKYTKRESELQEEEGRNSARMIMENFLIRIFGKEKFELKKSKKILDEIPESGIKITTANGISYKIMDLLMRFLEISIYLILGTLILQEGRFEISYLVMLTGYIWYLWRPIENAVNNLNKINKSWEKYKKLQNFIEKPNEIGNGTKNFQFKNGKIELKNLDFSYSSEKNIFKKLNLEFLEGKKNALVGHSGGGKSTITKILLRLYDYQKGEVLIDGQNLRDLKIETFYDKIGYLPQEPAVFDGTIRENLEYSFSEKCDLLKEEKEKLIWKSLKKSKISEMIKKLEKGLDTEIGEKGVKLSGGEKQRLVIARIFLKNPKIIILDEPTSALDSISEAGITESLNELMRGKTSIVIAHRLQTVMNSDKIFVIDDGKNKDSGNHDELLKKSEIYKKLVDLQNGKILEQI